MKRCPTCQRTYAEDAPDYCPTDGMRLVKETPGAQDHEREVLSSGLRVPTPVLPERPQAEPPAEAAEPSAPEPPPSEPLYHAPEDAGQQPQPSTQPPPPAPQFAPRDWSQPPPQPARPWGNQYQSPAPTTPIAPPQTPVAPPQTPAAPFQWPGRIEAVSVAALVTGCCAVTIMSALVAGSVRAVLTLMLVLAILGLALGVTGLILALQKPARFGGIPLAIAGLATGTAALVYYFTL